MEIFEFFKSISIELVGALIVFVLGLLFSKAPKSITKYRLKNIFGSYVFSDDFQIVYGIVQRFPESKKTPYQKRYHDGTIYKSVGTYKVIGDGMLRGYSYILQELSKYRKNQIIFHTDEIAYKQLNKTFIIMGGPLANELTDLAMKEKANNYFRFTNLEFAQSEDLRIETLNEDKNKRTYIKTSDKDYGIILKIKNSRFKDHIFIVCAGISSWGTSGALWYLANNWKKLYKEFKSKEFGIVLEVKIGSDTSAFRVYP